MAGRFALENTVGFDLKAVLHTRSRRSPRRELNTQLYRIELCHNIVVCAPRALPARSATFSSATSASKCSRSAANGNLVTASPACARPSPQSKSPDWQPGIPAMVRLQKFLAEAGVASRRAGERLIVEGRVEVNGQTVNELGAKVDPLHDRVMVDGRAVKLRRKLYLAINKPKGYICTRSDPEKRRIIT